MAAPGEAVVVRLPERFEVFYEREYHRWSGSPTPWPGAGRRPRTPPRRRSCAPIASGSGSAAMTQPGAWVRRVAANLAVSGFRRRLAEARALVRLAARRQPDPPLRPEVLDFWRTVRSLPRRQRQAVTLFHLEDWPVAEIARFLGCTETTVRGHLQRGRATLARRLGEAWKEEEP